MGSADTGRYTADELVFRKCWLTTIILLVLQMMNEHVTSEDNISCGAGSLQNREPAPPR